MLTLPSAQFNVSAEAPAAVAADWLALPVWADEPPYTGPYADLHKKFRESGDLSGKHLELLPLLNAMESA